MGDPLQRVRSGDPTPARAATWNPVLDVADWFRRRKLGEAGASLDADVIDPANTVLLKNPNSSITSWPAFSVLAYGDPVGPSPADGASERHAVQDRPCFEGVAPTDVDAPFAVTLEPIAGQRIGVAAAAGVAVVQVSVSDASHTRARPSIGVTTNLVSHATAGVPILWKESGTGTKWAVVLLGTAGTTPTTCCPIRPPTTTFAKSCSSSGTTLCCNFKVECGSNEGVGFSSIYVDTVDCFGRKITDAQMIQDCNAQIDQVIEFSTDLCSPGNAGGAGNPCGVDGGAVPGRICVHIYGGTRAYRSIVSYQVESQFSADAGGWPFSYTTPDGKVTVTGVIVPTASGFEFKGTISSDLDDPDHPSGFPCGCVVEDPSQTTDITCGADSSHPDISGTIHITTDCGELYIDVSPAPCVFVASYNCVGGYCIDPGNGTGTYSSLVACTTDGCSPPPAASFDCISGFCIDPGTGAGAYPTLADCISAGCSPPPPATYNCIGGLCFGVFGGGGTYATIGDCLAACSPPPPPPPCCNLTHDTAPALAHVTFSGAFYGTYPMALFATYPADTVAYSGNDGTGLTGYSFSVVCNPADGVWGLQVAHPWGTEVGFSDSPTISCGPPVTLVFNLVIGGVPTVATVVI